MDRLSSYPADPLDDRLLSPSFFDGFEDICFVDQPASLMLHAPPLTTLDASVLAGEDVCLNSTTSSCTAGSSPARRRALKRRYVGYSLDDFLRVGESQSTSFVKTVSTASATRTSCNSSTASTNCRRISTKRSIISKARRNIESESVRRKKMTRLFHTLWSLLPTSIPQGNRVLMIDETCRYITDLQKKLAMLKLRKTNMLASTPYIVHVYEGAGGGCDRKNDDIETLNYEESMTMGLSCEREPPYVRVTSTMERTIRIIVGGCVQGRSRFFSTILHILEMKGLDVTNANCSQVQDVVLYAINAYHPNLSKEELGELQEIIYFEAKSKL